MSRMTQRRRRRKRRLFVNFLLTAVFLCCAGALFLLTFFPLSYDEEIRAACETYDLSPSLVYAIVRVESNFDPSAQSGADARGLMQVTPATYRWSQLRLGNTEGTDPDELYDPATNIAAGTHILSLLYEEFNDTDTVIAAYNAGLGNVEKWLNDRRYTSNGKTLDDIPYGETARYVQKIKRAQFAYKMLYNLD